MAKSRLRKPGWLILGGLLLLGLLGFVVPPLARGMSFFRIRRVEFAGLSALSPTRLLREIHLGDTVSIFANLDQVADSLRTVPGIEDVKLRRRIPGTLRVEITEAIPVAVAAGASGMSIMDERGRALPLDPAETAPDLPVVSRPDSLVAGLLARVKRINPDLFARTSAAWRNGSDVVLDVEGRRYWFRPNATAEAILAVMAVAADLARKNKDYRELDGRFAGQVVVRWRGA
ncbi:MAG: FtsQ-type POTRA domain-containing protein [Gemmatimonadota bacterium]